MASKASKSKRKYILCIDGGGIRGIMPLVQLTKLESQLGKPCREIFSMITGTSSGALTAAALTAGTPAEQMLSMLTVHAKDIFPNYPLKQAKRLVTGSMYNTASLRSLMEFTLGGTRNWTLKDLPVDILITSKRLQDGRPWYFVRDNPKNSCLSSEVKLIDIALASAAAPTYFPPVKVPHIKRSPRETLSHLDDLFIDGGVGTAGNPVYQAAIEAFYYTDTYSPQTTTIVSLGTGRIQSTGKPTWLLPWVEWLIQELIDSPWEQQTELVRRHFPQTKLVRLDPDIASLMPEWTRDIALDDTGKLTILGELGNRWANQIDWNQILTNYLL